MAKRPSPRQAALNVLLEVVVEGRSLATALPHHQSKLPPQEQPLVQELCYGTLRWYHRLQGVARKLISRPFKKRDRDIELLILLGLYQLQYMKIPPHAAVAETVATTAAMGKGWAKGVTNAVLRRFQRESDSLLTEVDRDPARQLSHPQWLFERLRKRYPQQWHSILEANNQRPPMTLRVNPSHVGRNDYLQQLSGAGIAASPSPYSEYGLTLEKPVAVDKLPGFDEGVCSVQDEAAQLAAVLLDSRPGMRVLDACAAPGGKTGHILELTEGLELTALDADPLRLERVEENLERLGLSAGMVAGDAGEPQSWWDDRPFDRILLDAPCSATGVIRRHPDIKVLRKPDDIPRLVAEQRRLLEALWPLLATGGMLVYATCSVLPEENAEQITGFLQSHQDASELPLKGDWGSAAAAGRQIVPGQNGMDGFYYACLRKE